MTMLKWKQLYMRRFSLLLSQSDLYYLILQFVCKDDRFRTFAVSMCNKVSYMIQGQATTANMKLQLIPILQYMHHDTATAAMVRTLCVDLLPCYPAQDFVLIILNTLSKLAAATLVHIPNQVRFNKTAIFLVI